MERQKVWVVAPPGAVKKVCWDNLSAQVVAAVHDDSEPQEHVVVGGEVVIAQRPTKAKVILFKPSGKYYTEEEWEIPTAEELEEKQRDVPREMRHWEFLPTCMLLSKDFRRISGTGPVLVVAQEPWGFPHLFPGVSEEK